MNRDMLDPYEITPETQDEFVKLHNEYLNMMGRKTQLSPTMLRHAPDEYTPEFTALEYEATDAWRYFAQKANDPNAPVTEIDYEQYVSLRKTVFYRTIKVVWRISGSLNDRYDGNIKLEAGVIEFNTLRAKKADLAMRGVGKRLSDPLQFYKPS